MSRPAYRALYYGWSRNDKSNKPPADFNTRNRKKDSRRKRRKKTKKNLSSCLCVDRGWLFRIYAPNDSIIHFHSNESVKTKNPTYDEDKAAKWKYEYEADVRFTSNSQSSIIDSINYSIKNDYQELNP